MTGDLISRQAVLDAINSHHQITHIRAAVEAIPASDASAQVAAAYEAASALPGTSDWRWRFEPSWSAHELAEAIRKLTPADAVKALRQIKNEAYRAGQEAMRERAAANLRRKIFQSGWGKSVDEVAKWAAKTAHILSIEDLPEDRR